MLVPYKGTLLLQNHNHRAIFADDVGIPESDEELVEDIMPVVQEEIRPLLGNIVPSIECPVYAIIAYFKNL